MAIRMSVAPRVLSATRARVAKKPGTWPLRIGTLSVPLILTEPLGVSRPDYRVQDRADVGDCEHDRVLVAVEDRPVGIANAEAEQVVEGAAADDARCGALDHRAGGDQVGLCLEDLIRDPAAHLRLYLGLFERRRGVIGELARVEEHAGGVARDQRQEERNGGEDAERGGADPSGSRAVVLGQAGSVRRFPPESTSSLSERRGGAQPRDARPRAGRRARAGSPRRWACPRAAPRGAARRS